MLAVEVQDHLWVVLVILKIPVAKEVGGQEVHATMGLMLRLVVSI